MERLLSRLLRVSVACFLLSAAWDHFFWEAPYRAALEGYPGVASFLRLTPSAGDRLAPGVAVGWLLSGVATVLWRPEWLARALLVLVLVPLTGSLVAGAALADPVWSWVTTRVWGILATATLAMSGSGRPVVERFLLRAGLTAAFGTWALLGMGWVGGEPGTWLGAVRAFWPGGHGGVSHVHLLAGLVMGACVCLWTRPLGLAGSLLLVGAGLAAVLVPLGVRWEGSAHELWHRWVPEAVGKLGLAVLPVAVWVAGGRRRWLQAEPRRLRRVETPEERG